MMPPLLVFLAFIALVLTIAAAVQPPRVPLWIPMLLVCIILLLMVYGK